MTKTSLSSVLCLLSSLSLAAQAGTVTNTFVYSANFGRFAGTAIETVDLTTNVTMTVGLYGSSATGGQPLWCRRLDVPVWNGLFTVELDDARGTSDPELNPKYNTLAALLAESEPTAEWWVGISRPRIDGERPPLVEQDSPAHGKIAAVPFALQAGSAAAARGAFTVSGRVTVGGFKLTDQLDVNGNASFRGNVTFENYVIFGRDGLTVEGTLYRPELNGVGTLLAQKISATETIKAGKMVVTNGHATTIRPASAGVSTLRNVSVTGTLEASQGVRVGAVGEKGISAKHVVVTGTLSLEPGARFDWRTVGEDQPALSAPNGIYPATLTTKDVKTSTGSRQTYSNTSSKEMLTSLALSNTDGTNAVELAATSSREPDTNQPWCKAGPDGKGTALTVTVLCPLMPAGAKNACYVSGSGHVVSRTDKELAK